MTFKGRYQAIPVSERYWWKLVALSFIGWIFMYADRTILNPVMGKIGEQFGLSNGQLGLVNSIFFLAYALTQIPCGALGDKVGRKAVVAIGFIIFGITTYFSGVATSFFVFMVFRAITGAAQGAYYGPQYALSTEAIPTKKIAVGTAIINSGMAFGTSAGYIISSKLVLENGAHWATPFLYMSIPTVIFGILFYVLLKEKVVRPEDQVKQGQKSNVVDLDTTKPSLASIFKNKNLLCAFILCFCSIYANFVILTWLPQFLEIERGFKGADVGYIASLVPWASIPGALIFSYFSDKFKVTKKLVYFLMPLALLSTFGMAFVTNQTLLLVMLIVYGLTGKLALDPIIIAFVSKNASKQSLSMTLGAYNFIGMSGSVLAPYFTGWFADELGSMQVGFYFAAVLLFVGMIVFSFADEQGRTSSKLNLVNK